MQLGRNLLIAGGLGVASTALFAAGYEFRSSRELRALSARQADKQIRQDLLSILQPAGRFPHGMPISIPGVWITTMPYSTVVPNLCGEDVLELDYSQTENENSSADAPIRPYGIDAHHSFRFTKAPTSSELIEHLIGGGPDRFSTACSQVDVKGASPWISMVDDNPVVGLHAIMGMLAAVEAARTGKIEPSKCVGSTEDGNCLKELSEVARLDQLNDISRCEAPQGFECFELNVGKLVSITFKSSGGDPRPADIRSVKIEEYIIVT